MMAFALPNPLNGPRRPGNMRSAVVSDSTRGLKRATRLRPTKTALRIMPRRKAADQRLRIVERERLTGGLSCISRTSPRVGIESGARGGRWEIFRRASH